MITLWLVLGVDDARRQLMRQGFRLEVIRAALRFGIVITLVADALLGILLYNLLR